MIFTFQGRDISDISPWETLVSHHTHRSIGSDDHTATIASLPCGHFDPFLQFLNGYYGLLFPDLHSSQPSFFDQPSIKGLSHHHIGHGLGRFDNKEISSPVSKLHTIHRLINNRFEIGRENSFNSGGEPPAADFVPGMNLLIKATTDIPNWLNSYAVEAPAGPMPTTITSY